MTGVFLSSENDEALSGFVVNEFALLGLGLFRETVIRPLSLFTGQAMLRDLDQVDHPSSVDDEEADAHPIGQYQGITTGLVQLEAEMDRHPDMV